MPIKMTGCSFEGNGVAFVFHEKMQITCLQCGHVWVIESGSHKATNTICQKCGGDSVSIIAATRQEVK